MLVQKRKRKGEDKIMQEYTRKKAKEAKSYTQAVRELKCAYNSKSYLPRMGQQM